MQLLHISQFNEFQSNNTPEESKQEDKIFYTYNKNLQLQCNYCDQTFDKKSLLEKHIYNKHEIRFMNYKCYFCVKTFSNYNYLNTHMIDVHKKLRIYECDYCDISFKLPYLLKKHIGESYELQGNALFYDFEKFVIF